MKIALIDDVDQDRCHLRNCLNQYGAEHNIEMEIHMFSDADTFLKQFQKDYALIIFDIDMPGLNGMDAAKKLREAGEDTAVMFVTGMPQYAIDGYAVDALDYILKPVEYSEFCLKMQRVLRFVARNQEHIIHIHAQDGIHALRVMDIYYIESRLHYLTWHTDKGEYRTRSTLNEVQRSIGLYHFSRASVSFLVNLKYVEALSGDMLTVQGEDGSVSIKISRSKKEQFLSEFTRYIGGMKS